MKPSCTPGTATTRPPSGNRRRSIRSSMRSWEAKMTDSIRVDFGTLERFMAQALTAAGVPKADATTVAQVLVKADMLGIDSHGINRLKPVYIDRIRQGI